MSPLSIVARLALVASLVRLVGGDCLSFGMDFQNGGSYFQNSLSTDPFTFVSQFEGCQADTAINIFVDPSGDQYQCTNTNLTPDDTDQMSTCPLNKNQLYSGEWSVIIISNNGNADPIAYERDFSLSVGPQSTSTYTPTVTVPFTSTPVVNATVTTTDTATSTLVPVTVTKPSTTLKPTTTITPSRVTTTTTKYLLTLKLTSTTLSIVKATSTVTASCSIPKRQPTRDPTCTVKPTINGITAAALQTQAAKAKFRRVPGGGVVFVDKVTFLKERSERLALQERAPDPQPLVVTETSTSNFVTTTSTITADATTVTQTTGVTVTSTSTPAPVTVYSGISTASIVTVTAPTPTKTNTKYAIATSWTTKTSTTTVTIKTKTTPLAVKTSCAAHGGVLV